jgi:hypothetical protein
MIVRWLYQTAVNIIKATCLSLSAERSIIYCNLHVNSVSHVLIKREYKVLFFSLSSWTLFDRQTLFNGLFSAHVHSIYMKITAIRYWIHNIYREDPYQIFYWKFFIFIFSFRIFVWRLKDWSFSQFVHVIKISDNIQIGNF